MSVKISIITITFNSEKTLEQTIKSVVSQSYDNLEYIIIDGGSNDGTLDLVNKYRDKISVVVSEKDKGISDAFNKGITRATGDIIGIINSDDLLAKNALKLLSENYDENVDVYRGNLIIWDEISNQKYINKPTIDFSLSGTVRSVCHPSTFISRRSYERFGVYDENMKYMMDADLLFRFYRKGAIFKHVDFELAIFRLGGATSDDWKIKVPEYKKVLEKNGASRSFVFFNVLKYRIRNYMKNLLFSVMSPQKLRRIRYSKEN